MDLESIPDTLPDKMSELLTMGLDDLEKVEKLKDQYDVDFGEWHWPQPDGRCAVCFGGAVMAQTVGLPLDLRAIPNEFSGSLRKKIEALDSLRRGMIQWAAEHLGIKGNFEEFHCEIEEYEDDPLAFKRELRALANRLSDAGL